MPPGTCTTIEETNLNFLFAQIRVSYTAIGNKGRGECDVRSWGLASLQLRASHLSLALRENKVSNSYLIWFLTSSNAPTHRRVRDICRVIVM